MAIKQKKQELKKSRLWELITTEHKWENYAFVVISLLTLVLGVLILTSVLTVKSNFPLLGAKPKLFAWILVGISSFGLIYALYPFFKPAWPELKKVTWPTGKTFVGNSVRVFIFVICMALIFLAYDIIIAALMGKIF